MIQKILPLSVYFTDKFPELVFKNKSTWEKFIDHYRFLKKKLTGRVRERVRVY